MQLVLLIVLSNKIAILGPWLKFLIAKRSSRTGEDDGLKEKIHESFLGLEICRSIVAFFIPPPKIAKIAYFVSQISSWKRHLEKKKEHTMRKLTENPLKLSAHILESRNFVTEIFHRKFA